MIGYDELVEALAAWRSRQGMAETGSDYLGPPTPFPVYQVEHPTESRSYAGMMEEAQVIDEGDAEVIYSDAEATEFSESYDEGGYDQGEVEAIDASELEVESLQADDDGQQAEYEIGEPASYDDQTDANVDVAALAGEDEAAPAVEMSPDDTQDVAVEDYVEEDDEYAPEVVAEEAAGEDVEAAADVEPSADETQAEGTVADETQADETPADESASEDAAPDAQVYAAEERTEVGIGIEALAPGENIVADSIENDLDSVEIEDGDSVNYGEDDDDSDSDKVE